MEEDREGVLTATKLRHSEKLYAVTAAATKEESNIAYWLRNVVDDDCDPLVDMMYDVDENQFSTSVTDDPSVTNRGVCDSQSSFPDDENLFESDDGRPEKTSSKGRKNGHRRETYV